MLKKKKIKSNDKNLEIIKKYNQYNLSKIIRESVPWMSGDFVMKDNENILMKIYYRNEGTIIEENEGWYGNNGLLIYIVETKGKYKIKYLNLKDTEKKAMDIAHQIITNLGHYQQFEVGFSSKQYKEYVRNEKMVEIEIRSDLYLQIKELGNIDYDNLEYFTYIKSNESIDYFDFVNKKYFYCDMYCLEKYKPCIELIEKIINKCEILNLNELRFTYFPESERLKIMQQLIENYEEELNSIL